jgi:hypothetical protein
MELKAARNVSSSSCCSSFFSRFKFYFFFSLFGVYNLIIIFASTDCEISVRLNEKKKPVAYSLSLSPFVLVFFERIAQMQSSWRWTLANAAHRLLLCEWVRRADCVCLDTRALSSWGNWTHEHNSVPVFLFDRLEWKKKEKKETIIFSFSFPTCHSPHAGDAPGPWWPMWTHTHTHTKIPPVQKVHSNVSVGPGES